MLHIRAWIFEAFDFVYLIFIYFDLFVGIGEFLVHGSRAGFRDLNSVPGFWRWSIHYGIDSLDFMHKFDIFGLQFHDVLVSIADGSGTWNLGRACLGKAEISYRHHLQARVHWWAQICLQFFLAFIPCLISNINIYQKFSLTWSPLNS